VLSIRDIKRDSRVLVINLCKILNIMNTFRWIILTVFFGMVQAAQGQGLGIGTVTPDPSSALDITSTNGGILIPRMTSAQRDAIESPASGLLVFVTDPGNFSYYNGIS
jgi:hypothetical protein